MAPESADLIEEIEAQRERSERLLEAAQKQLRDAERVAKKLADAEREGKKEVREAVQTLRRAGLLPSK